jgi:hypothetical protein
MLARTMKPVLIVVAAGIVSMTSLMLPATRFLVDSLTLSHLGSFSCSGLRGIAERTYSEFGNIAADMACAYLKKLGPVETSSYAARTDAQQRRNTTNTAEVEAGLYSLAAER